MPLHIVLICTGGYLAKLKFNDEGVIYNSLKILRQVEPRITKAGNKEARVEAECLLCGKVKKSKLE